MSKNQSLVASASRCSPIHNMSGHTHIYWSSLFLENGLHLLPRTLSSLVANVLHQLLCSAPALSNRIPRNPSKQLSWSPPGHTRSWSRLMQNSYSFLGERYPLSFMLRSRILNARRWPCLMLMKQSKLTTEELISLRPRELSSRKTEKSLRLVTRAILLSPIRKTSHHVTRELSRRLLDVMMRIRSSPLKRKRPEALISGRSDLEANRVSASLPRKQ